MAVAGKFVQAVMARSVVVEPTKRFALALRQEAAVLRAGEENEPRVRARRLSREVPRQLAASIDGDEMPHVDAFADLLEEGHRHSRELSLQPLVRFVVQVLVPPERRKAAPIGEADLLANGVVALAVGQLNNSVDGLSRQRRCAQPPLRVEVARQLPNRRDRVVQLQVRPARHKVGSSARCLASRSRTTRTRS